MRSTTRKLGAFFFAEAPDGYTFKSGNHLSFPFRTVAAARDFASEETIVPCDVPGCDCAPKEGDIDAD